MSMTFAETTELELVVLPVAFSDEDPGEEEEGSEGEEDLDNEDFSEDLDEEDLEGDEEEAE